MNAAEKLRELVTEIRDPPDPMRIADAWSLASRLLSRFPGIDHDEAARACTERDADALDAIVTLIEHPERAAPPAPASESEIDQVSDEQMKAAMKAFRKRLRLARLADESKLGGHKLSGGRTSNIDAIIPPNDYPWQVWAALAKAGKLEDTGEGFYALPAGERSRPPG